MKRYPIIFLILIVVTKPSFAGEIGDVLRALRASKTVFGDLWANSCSPGFEMEVPISVLDNDMSFVKPGIQAGLLITEKLNAQKILIARGPVCDALARYYFDNSTNETVIDNFIKKDNGFKSSFGFSSIDAWGLQ